MREQNVEKLFKDTFGNFEADVNPSAWANIEQSLPSSPQNVPGGKPSGFFGKMYLSTIALVVVISAALIGTVLYLSSEKSVSKDVVAQNVQTQPQSSDNNSIVVSKSAPAATGNNLVTAPKNTAAEKQTARKAEEKIILNEPKQTPAETKTTSTPKNNAIQILVDEGVFSQPGTSSQSTTGGNGKTLVPTQNNQQEAPKVYTPPSTETSTSASAGPSTTGVPTEMEMSTAEYKEEFKFYIPNVFTPNGDMVNDYFTPMAGSRGMIKEYELVIYDRYGFEIFRSNDISTWWDGKLKNGTMAAQAVYVYIIKLTDFKGEAHDYMGHVTLLRGKADAE